MSDKEHIIPLPKAGVIEDCVTSSLQGCELKRLSLYLEKYHMDRLEDYGIMRTVDCAIRLIGDLACEARLAERASTTMTKNLSNVDDVLGIDRSSVGQLRSVVSEAVTDMFSNATIDKDKPSGSLGVVINDPNGGRR